MWGVECGESESSKKRFFKKVRIHLLFLIGVHFVFLIGEQKMDSEHFLLFRLGGPL